MTELEIRLRRELRDWAGQVTPADLRPLREPGTTARSRHLRWLAPAGAMAAVAAVIVSLALAGHAGRPRVPASVQGGPALVRPAADPPAFAAAIRTGTSLRRGIAVRVVLVSPRTGRIVRSVATTTIAAGIANRFAFSPDSRFVYVQQPLGAQRSAIQQISVAGGSSRVVGYGVDPTISPDGRQLAYAAGGTATIAIRDLRTGVVRQVSILKLIRPDYTMAVGAQLAWLGDGTQLAVVPQSVARTSYQIPANGDSASTGGSSAHAREQFCLILIGTSGARPRARWTCLPLAGSSGLAFPGNTVIAGAADPHRLLIAESGGSNEYNAVEAVELSRSGAAVAAWQIRTLPAGAVPVAIAPLGDRLILRTYTPGPPNFLLVGLSGAGLTREARSVAIPNPRKIVQVAW
ncbi:MAG TPA: hypothetical protein VNF47_00855 [Streptosporangiaceae bacterium]|nr:hypothetical protein [Streptosporangiaceae bacterium]